PRDTGKRCAIPRKAESLESAEPVWIVNRHECPLMGLLCAGIEDRDETARGGCRAAQLAIPTLSSFDAAQKVWHSHIRDDRCRFRCWRGARFARAYRGSCPSAPAYVIIMAYADHDRASR